MIYKYHGEVWLRKTMPIELLAQAQRFILARPERKYLFLVIGTHDNGRREITEAVAVEDSNAYLPITRHLPLTINYHTHTAMGPKAVVFGRWQLQYLKPIYRGLLHPVPKLWVRLSDAGNFFQAKQLLLRQQKENKKLPARLQGAYRLKLIGPATGHDVDPSYHFHEDHLNTFFA